MEKDINNQIENQNSISRKEFIRTLIITNVIHAIFVTVGISFINLVKNDRSGEGLVGFAIIFIFFLVGGGVIFGFILSNLLLSTFRYTDSPRAFHAVAYTVYAFGALLLLLFAGSPFLNIIMRRLL